MHSRDKNIGEVLSKYVLEERDVEKKMRECEKKRQEMSSKKKSSLEHCDFLTNNISIEKETSLLRNQRLLKDLEKTKARLRTLATFSPTDQELYDLATFYRSSFK